MVQLSQSTRLHEQTVKDLADPTFEIHFKGEPLPENDGRPKVLDPYTAKVDPKVLKEFRVTVTTLSQGDMSRIKRLGPTDIVITNPGVKG